MQRGSWLIWIDRLLILILLSESLFVIFCGRHSGVCASFSGLVVVVLAFVFLLVEEREAEGLELFLVLLGSEGA